MSAKTISYGSSGEDVKKLQAALNKNGYSLDVDGKFGPKTQSAVKDYQTKNGLSVDGIVGKETWKYLNENNSTPSAATGSSSSSKGFEYNVKRPEYKKSQSLIESENNYSQWESNKPAEYSGKYSDDINNILDAILNREEFDYKLSGDPMYEQYREMYVENGKKAMMDTIGQASALTGGYNNSYAQTVGNQIYNERLSELNEIALELRDRAYEEYMDGTDKLMSDLNVLRSLDGEEYERYLDDVEQYYRDGDFLLRKLSNLSDSEFELFSQEVEIWENNRDFAFDMYQDEMEREEFEKEMDFKREEAERDQRNKDRQHALDSGKKSSSDNNNKNNETDNKKKGENREYMFYPKTYNEFCERTGIVTILTKEEFDSSSDYRERYKGNYQAYLKDMYDRYMG